VPKNIKFRFMDILDKITLNLNNTFGKIPKRKMNGTGGNGEQQNGGGQQFVNGGGIEQQNGDGQQFGGIEQPQNDGGQQIGGEGGNGGNNNAGGGAANGGNNGGGGGKDGHKQRKEVLNLQFIKKN
jgi:hypothetical protein